MTFVMWYVGSFIKWWFSISNLFFFSCLFRYTPNGAFTPTPPTAYNNQTSTPGQPGLSYDIGGDFVDSTTSSGFEPVVVNRSSSSSELPDSQNMINISTTTTSSTSSSNNNLPSANSIQISELLARTITDAHNRTCLYSTGKRANSLKLILKQTMQKIMIYECILIYTVNF